MQHDMQSLTALASRRQPKAFGNPHGGYRFSVKSSSARHYHPNFEKIRGLQASAQI